MSGQIKHLPIQSSEAPSAQQDFAEQQYELLAAYSVTDLTHFGSTAVEYALTDRCDFTLESGEDIVVRLVRNPVFAFTPDSPQKLPEPSTDYVPSRDYVVLQMQHGTTQVENYCATDEDFRWATYVTTIIPTDNPEEVQVVNPDTGEELDIGDIMQAEFVLNLLRQELRGMRLEDLEDADITEPEYAEEIEQPDYAEGLDGSPIYRGDKSVPFNVGGDNYLRYACDKCCTANTPAYITRLPLTS